MIWISNLKIITKKYQERGFINPKDIEEFVENAVVIAGIDFGDGPYLPTIAHLMTCFLKENIITN